MKKILVSMLIVSLLASFMTPIAFAETVTETIYNENFESGVFTVVTNEENTVKEVYKDGAATGLIYAKTNGAAFSSFPEAVVVDAATTQTPVNDTKALSTDAYKLVDTQLYMNLPETYDSGILTVSFRILREATGTNIRLRLTEDAVTNAVYDGTSSVCFVYGTRGSSSSPDVYAYNYTTTDTDYAINANRDILAFTSNRNSVKGYVPVVYTIDLDNNTCSATVNGNQLVTDVALCDNGESVSALVFDAISSLKPGNGNNLKQGKLAIDDLVVTHTYEDEAVVEDPKAEVEDLAINADGTFSASATFNYLDTDSAAKSARLVVAAYNGNDLLAVKSCANATVDSVNTSAQLSTEAISIPVGTTKIKAFVWDFATLKPYATTEIPVN